MKKFAAYDTADYLTDEETIAEYRSAALQDTDPDMFLVAVKNVARARHAATRQRYRPRAGKPIQGARARREATIRHRAEGIARPGR